MMLNRLSSPVLEMSKDNSSKRTIEESIIHRLSENIGKRIQVALEHLEHAEQLEEIRLRVNQPIILRTNKREIVLTPLSSFGTKVKTAVVIREDLTEILEKMTYSSIYAAEEELRQGFITLPGGHRVGITGETVVENGKIRTIRNISALNIRLARQPDAKNISHLLSCLLDKNKVFCHTLLVSPPRAGKTTILRLLVQRLSDGVKDLGLEGQTVGVVDERSEIAGMWQGNPSFNLGCRTDVLDRCPKVSGLNMLIRSMSPSIVAVDELGGVNDVAALQDALRCGVKILATAHAENLEELQRRPYLQELLTKQVFERIVILSRRKGPGTIEAIYDMVAGKVMEGSKLC